MSVQGVPKENFIDLLTQNYFFSEFVPSIRFKKKNTALGEKSPTNYIKMQAVSELILDGEQLPCSTWFMSLGILWKPETAKRRKQYSQAGFIRDFRICSELVE